MKLQHEHIDRVQLLFLKSLINAAWNASWMEYVTNKLDFWAPNLSYNILTRFRNQKLTEPYFMQFCLYFWNWKERNSSLWLLFTDIGSISISPIDEDNPQAESNVVCLFACR
jgi:hypothetical protein